MVNLYNKISYQDLQHIKDEPSLIEFMREKLNIPIPNDLILKDISSKYSNYSLGLNESNSNLVLDCQELSLIPGQPSGILIIRFNNQSGYSGVLHAISNVFQQHGKNLEDLRFICTSEDYQPFAIAYLKEAKIQDSSDADLYILAWIQGKTFVNTNYNHDIPDIFVKKREEFKITSEDLLEKLEKIGTPLSEYCSIHQGITTGNNPAFVVNDEVRNRLITDHQESEDIIKLVIGKHQERRWKPSYKNVIWIPSSNIKNWPWSNAKSESKAENIFQETYPSISNHLKGFLEEINNRAKGSRGMFYWELNLKEHYEKFQGPKITIYDKPPIMAFFDESDAIVINPYVHCIQTSDLSILAILNSSLFNWYLHTKFETKDGGCLNKCNLGLVPISTNYMMSELITDLVQQLLDTIDNQNITDLEEEIDMLVYKMYQLTDEEILYIKNSQNKFDNQKDIKSTKKFSDEDDTPLDENADNEETEEMIEIPENPNFSKVSTIDSISLESGYIRRQTQVNKLLTKIIRSGTPLINHVEMFGGPSIQPPLSSAFVIDELKRQELITADPNNDQLIIPVVYMPYNCKWNPEWRYLINISNSEFKDWPWSDAETETIAEKIFSEIYPSISQHIFQYRDKLIDKSGI